MTSDSPWSSASGGPRRSVNVDTDWEQVPGCGLSGVLEAILKHMIGLSATFGVDARILTQEIYMKSAFRQGRMGPDDASRFAYRFGQFFFAGFHLQFGVGRRGSPRWWGLVARAIEEARRKVTTDRAVVGGGKDRVPGD